MPNRKHSLFCNTAFNSIRTRQEGISRFSAARFMAAGVLILLSMLVGPASAQTAGQYTIASQEYIYEKAPFKSCHASTIAETPKGIVAAWFGGTHEKNKDVEIWLSRRVKDAWTAPVSVANGMQSPSVRYPCWNPVLFQYPGGPLMLFYKVGPDPVDWWGEYKTSTNGGQTWSAATKLPSNILGPIKNKPVLLSDGRLICPSSTEDPKDGRWRVHLEITEDKGKTWTTTGPLNDGIQLHIIQPSLLSYPNGKLQLVCRSMEDRLVSIWSTDNGSTWSAPEKLAVPNPNSGTDAVTLKNNTQLLVYNPTERTKGEWGGPRSPLKAAVSTNGYQWTDVATLETEKGEFSYPAVIQSADGLIHITYTWNREKIKHVVLIGKPEEGKVGG